MTDDELRAAIDAMMADAACDRCDAVLEVVVRHYDDGPTVVYPRVTHESGCSAA